ncbi:MAG TPA: 50S ribosomal protein L19 [Candidatus Paceibacterota bacterium]|nr:50S ribosomal protein L19 [Candidatus Paceibacterota bacterium]HRY76565.1 50S ribosomal protein L19 [Candidatus Paceibacterota bacterium]
MTKQLMEFNKQQLRSDLPELKPGMQVRVFEKIKEGDRERLQAFEGVVIAKKHGKGVSATVTVRGILSGVGVEKIWPIHSPKIAKIEILKTPLVRRAKLYFLRNLSAKKTRKKLSVFKNIVVAPKAEEKQLEAEQPVESSPEEK